MIWGLKTVTTTSPTCICGPHFMATYHYRKLASFAAAVSLGGWLPLNAELVEIDFTSYESGGSTIALERGERLLDQYQEQYGLSIRGYEIDNLTDQNIVKEREVWIFDTDNATGDVPGTPSNYDRPSGNDGDPDLDPTYFNGVSDPGRSIGNSIIIQEDYGSNRYPSGPVPPRDAGNQFGPHSIFDRPDDDGFGGDVGGMIVLTWDNPISLQSVGILDIENSEGNTIIAGYANKTRTQGETPIFFKDFKQVVSDQFSGQTGKFFGDETYVDVMFDELPVQRLEVLFEGSGSIGSFTVAVVPEPFTVGSMGAGAIFLFLFVQRLKKKKAQSSK